MVNIQKQFNIQFKKDAVKFYEEHPDMTHTECAAYELFNQLNILYCNIKSLFFNFHSQTNYRVKT